MLIIIFVFVFISDVIKFNNVIINVGGGYNRLIGIFIVFVVGYYEFIVIIMV